MIVSESDALGRLGSPLNLMNRMRSSGSRANAMGLFGVGNKAPAAPAQTSAESSANSSSGAVAPTFNPFPAKSQSATALVPSSVIIDRPQIPVAPTIPTEDSPTSKLDELLDNADSNIKLGLAHNKALDTLSNAIDEVKIRIPEIKADKLPSVITAMSKVVSDIQRQRVENKKANVDNRSVHFHYYTPTQKAVTDYEVIEVG